MQKFQRYKSKLYPILRLFSTTNVIEQTESEDESEAHIDAEVAIIRDHFDTNYYMARNPDVAASGKDPLRHFCQYGWREGRDPSADFSTNFYLTVYPDIEAAEVNPFWHYIVAGQAEGRAAMNVVDRAAQAKKPDIQTDIEAIRERFDASFYLFTYPDVAQAGLDPLEHYWNNGWKEGRDPNATFSTAFYLDTNPDVADLGINPFWHYVVAGSHEGRVTQHPGGYRVGRLVKLDSLEQEVRRWSRSDRPEKLLGSDELSGMILDARSNGSRELLLSVGHDHYRKNSGGVQLCEHREEAICGTNGKIYLQIHPWNPKPRLAHTSDSDGEDPIMCLLLNGADLGSCRTSDLLKAVTNVVPELDQAQIVIHQLLGHLPERIADLIRAAGRNECWLWLHDFLTICPSFTLQRNGVSFCGAPPLGSNACTLCRYGNERRTHAARIATFFEEINVHVLSPSEVAADTWTKRSGLTPASLKVVPHMTLDWRKRATPPPQASDKITIGFLGTPAPHKGWNMFENLVNSFGQSDAYRFVFLGSGGLPANGIDHFDVHVTANNPDAMIHAVQQEKIDLVLHWASWPETFSLSTYEAYAGGAYVVTNQTSGNVAATVDRLKRGAVLEDEAALKAFFEDGRADELVRALRADRGKHEVHHQLSRMVHDAIDAAVIEGRP